MDHNNMGDPIAQVFWKKNMNEKMIIQEGGRETAHRTTTLVDCYFNDKNIQNNTEIYVYFDYIICIFLYSVNQFSLIWA